MFNYSNYNHFKSTDSELTVVALVIKLGPKYIRLYFRTETASLTAHVSPIYFGDLCKEAQGECPVTELT